MTHGLSFLPQCDLIVVMNEGRITEVGSYSELIDNDGPFAEFIRAYAATDENEDDVDGSEFDGPSRPTYVLHRMNNKVGSIC